jgi:hypothetical protein
MVYIQLAIAFNTVTYFFLNSNVIIVVWAYLLYMIFFGEGGGGQ